MTAAAAPPPMRGPPAAGATGNRTAAPAWPRTADAQDWLSATMARLSPGIPGTPSRSRSARILSQKEAAEVLGLSEGTVAWRMSEVKKRLREMARAEGML